MSDDDDYQMEPNKRRTNWEDHGVSLEAAERTFDDPLALDFEDRRFLYNEDRRCIIGMVDGRLLHVTYTDIDDETRHIISARGAEPHERRRYHQEPR